MTKFKRISIMLLVLGMFLQVTPIASAQNNAGINDKDSQRSDGKFADFKYFALFFGCLRTKIDRFAKT